VHLKQQYNLVNPPIQNINRVAYRYVRPREAPANVSLEIALF
jgi:hypothetical protein